MPKYNQPRKTWRYSDTFKVKAVQLSLLDGVQVKAVAETLGNHPILTALKSRECGEQMIFHTDRGIEYTAYKYRNALIKLGMQQSLNRAGHCTNNVHMESFFHSLKAELIRGRNFKSAKELRYALNSYINQFYNHKRLHSDIGYLPPAVYEQRVA
jgi:putative transposase